MYAVVEIAGQQFVVKKGAQIKAPKLNAQAGDTLQFDKVLMTSDDEKVQVGKPVVPNVKVTATKLDDTRGKKVIVFKKKRRKGYRWTRGHRHEFSLLKIDDIIVEGGTENGA
ncbi:50S ribosomal protein L21 [candidate division KSB1 bacterium]|nr:50S ribosomal protein L21 [candidate division KSB1 bacterium]